jgi:hypothetical protein
MQRNLTLLSLSSLVLLAGCSRIVVKHLTAADAPAIANGVIYALPKTVVRIQAKIDKTVSKGAPFSDYAPIFAPNLDPVCPDKDCGKDGKIEYSVEDGVVLSTYGEPDPDQVFLVEFSGAGAVDQALNMAWNDAGLLSTASSTVTNRTADVIVAGIGTAASIASKTLFGASAPGAPLVQTACDVSIPTDSQFFADINDVGIGLDDMVKSYLLTNFCAMDTDKRGKLSEPQFKKVLLTYVRDVAPFVLQRNNLLVKAGGLFDPTALIARIDTEITAKLLPLFVGTKTTKTWNAMMDTRNVAGNGDAINSVPFLRLGSNGVEMIAEVPPEGTPEPAEFRKPATGKEVVLQLNLSYRPAKSAQLFTKIKDDDHGDRSFRYRMPALVRADFVDDTQKSYGGAVLSVAQLGTIISLPASRHSKSLTYNLGMVEATGALKSFALSTTGAVDAATVSSFGTSAGTVLDARTAAATKAATAATTSAAEAATAADPATALTKQDTLLKLQDDICTIKAKYNLPCTVQPQ